jgi:hypothetical protein
MGLFNSIASMMAAQGQPAIAPPPPQPGQAPLQFTLPQNIPAPQAHQSQTGQGAGQMPQGTMDMIMKLFAAGA